MASSNTTHHVSGTIRGDLLWQHCTHRLMQSLIEAKFVYDIMWKYLYLNTSDCSCSHLVRCDSSHWWLVDSRCQQWVSKHYGRPRGTAALSIRLTCSSLCGLPYMWVISLSWNCRDGSCFPDPFHRLNKGTSLLIGSRSAVTCRSKQTLPWSCEQAIPTSWLCRLLTPTTDNAYVKSLLYSHWGMEKKKLSW